VEELIQDGSMKAWKKLMSDCTVSPCGVILSFGCFHRHEWGRQRVFVAADSAEHTGTTYKSRLL